MAQAHQDKFLALTELVDDHTIAIAPFWDLAEKEIKLHNNTDFDDLEFLIKAAKAQYREFAAKAWRLYGEDQEASA